jgi:hypothetical protein
MKCDGSSVSLRKRIRVWDNEYMGQRDTENHKERF